MSEVSKQRTTSSMPDLRLPSQVPSHRSSLQYPHWPVPNYNLGNSGTRLWTTSPVSLCSCSWLGAKLMPLHHQTTLPSRHCLNHMTKVSYSDKIIKPESATRGLMVIATSMHGFANFQKFNSPVILTLTLDRVKVISTCTIPVVLPACPTIWL